MPDDHAFVAAEAFLTQSVLDWGRDHLTPGGARIVASVRGIDHGGRIECVTVRDFLTRDPDSPLTIESVDEPLALAASSTTGGPQCRASN